jgi:hypothetical protein
LWFDSPQMAQPFAMSDGADDGLNGAQQVRDSAYCSQDEVVLDRVIRQD